VAGAAPVEGRAAGRAGGRRTAATTPPATIIASRTGSVAIVAR
jgi:hypothetical protein